MRLIESRRRNNIVGVHCADSYQCSNTPHRLYLRLFTVTHRLPARPAERRNIAELLHYYAPDPLQFGS